MVRTPAKVLDSPDQTPVLFEFEVEDVDVKIDDDAATNTTTEAADSSTAAAVVPRLSYLISGPGVGDEWEAVPAVPREEWEALVVLTAANNGTASIFSSGGGDGGGGGGSSSSGSSSVGGGFVWGLELESLDDGDYRLQVRQAGGLADGERR